MTKYNKTIHRFPPKPYIKVHPAKLQLRLDQIADKKATRKFVLMESEKLKEVKVVTDTMLIERARSMVDATYVDPIKWLRDNQEEDKDSG